MEMKRNKHIGLIALFILFFIFTSSVFAASSDFFERANEYYQRRCTEHPERLSRSRAFECYLFDKVSELDATIGDLQTQVANNSADITALEGRKTILDYAQVRGANWETSTINTPVETPDHVTVNCPEACVLWVNFDVDTRNPNGSIAQSSWPQHLYHIYVDGINQAVFNQASMIVANAAIPLAVNGVFPVSAGEHTVTIYALTTGGILQQFESHLQVLAIE